MLEGRKKTHFFYFVFGFAEISREKKKRMQKNAKFFNFHFLERNSIWNQPQVENCVV